MELFVELSVILVIAAAVAAGAKLLRQPLIISYIFAGLLLGPYFLNVVHSEDVFSNFSRFGIALLLFIQSSRRTNILPSSDPFVLRFTPKFTPE